MDGQTLAFILALIASAALLFMSVFYLVAFADLESRFISSATCCDRVNKVVFPEIGLMALLSTCLLYFRCYYSLMYTAPMFVWLICRIATKPAGNIAFYDPAEIHNRNALKKFTQESIVKLVYHIAGFFLFLYSIITSILAEGGMDISGLEDSPHPFKPITI